MSEADAEIKSAEAAINPLLESAKITTIDVSGKPVAATSEEVPLALKIAAFAGTVKAGAADAQVSQMAANNTILAGEATALKTRAVTAETSNATLVGENETLKARIGVLEKNVQTLTAENAQVLNLQKAANTEAGRVTELSNGLNSELSRVCLAHCVLTDLKDKDGKLLPSTATASEREAAADLIPAADKLKALAGAVSSTLSKLGVSLAAIPGAGSTVTGTTPATKDTMVARYRGLLAEGKTAEAAAFYRDNLAK